MTFGASAGGLVLAMAVPVLVRAQAPKGFGAAGDGATLASDDPMVFVAIAPDGTVTVTILTAGAEMGQGVR